MSKASMDRLNSVKSRCLKGEMMYDMSKDELRKALSRAIGDRDYLFVLLSDTADVMNKLAMFKREKGDGS